MNNPIELAVVAMGTQTALAEALGVRSPSISEWKIRAVPAERCESIEKLTSGAVTCEQLRPDLDWLRDARGNAYYRTRAA